MAENEDKDKDKQQPDDEDDDPGGSEKEPATLPAEPTKRPPKRS